MARPYSNDLRRKLLESYDAGRGTFRQLAEQFGVSLAWAQKIARARKRTGSTDRPLYRSGPKARVDREVVRAILLGKPDLYLREVRAELKASTGVDVSTPHLWKIVGELGFRVKKSRSTPASGTPKRTVFGARPS
jgi:transposase